MMSGLHLVLDPSSIQVVSSAMVEYMEKIKTTFNKRTDKHSHTRIFSSDIKNQAARGNVISKRALYTIRSNNTKKSARLKQINQNMTEQYFSLSDLNAKRAELMLPNTFIMVFYIVFGCLSNFTVFFVYTFKMRNTLKERFFNPVLAAIDLVTVIVSTSLNLTLNTLSDMYPGSAACKSLIYFSYLTTITSMGVLLLIAVQRYQKVCKPLQPQMTLRLKVISIGIVVLVVALFHIPVLFFYGVVSKENKTYNITTFKCTKLPGSEGFNTGVTTFQAIDVVITMAIMFCALILYGLIGKVIFVTLKPSRGTFFSPSKHSRSSDRELEFLDSATVRRRLSRTLSEKSRIKSTKNQFTYMYMVISFLALVTNIPPWIIIIIESKDPQFWTELTGWRFHVVLFLRRIYILDHVLNPVIFGVFDARLRRELKTLICKCKNTIINVCERKSDKRNPKGKH